MLFNQATRGLLLILVALALFAPSVKADLGPKPSMDIQLVQKGVWPVDAQFGMLLQCQNTYPSEFARPGQTQTRQGPFEFSDYDAQRQCTWQYAPMAWGECKRSSCHFGYALPSDFRLAVKLTNGHIASSAPVNRTAFRSAYTAEIHDDGTISITPALVSATEVLLYAVNLVITLLFELPVWLAYALVRRKPKFKLLITLIVANAISLAALWLIVIKLGAALGTWTNSALVTLGVLLVGEIGVTAFEAWAVVKTLPQDFSYRSALPLSILANLITTFSGFALYSMGFGLL